MARLTTDEIRTYRANALDQAIRSVGGGINASGNSDEIIKRANAFYSFLTADEPPSDAG